MKGQEPIFIVGAPRSGTTLLAAMLSSHSQLSCGPETHFFRNLSKIDPGSLYAQDTWPEPAKEFIFSITHTNFSKNERTPLLEKYGLSQSEITDFLNSCSPSIDNILSSVTEQYMTKAGKMRWVEKTPDHIDYLEDIRRYFPHSPIIRIVRDPRDVALSSSKLPWGSETFLHGLLSWKKIDLGSDIFFSQDNLSYSLHFEDLITSPREELQKICQFIHENFEESMLDTTKAGKQLNSRNVTWKMKASQPLDPSRIYTWRLELTPNQQKMAGAMIGDRIIAHGYELNQSFTQIGEFFPSCTLAAKYQDGIEDILNTGIRFWKVQKSEKTNAVVYLGDPGSDRWFRKNRLSGSIDALFLSFKIFVDKFTKKSIYWIPKNTENDWSGYNSFFIKKILAAYKVSAAL